MEHNGRQGGARAGNYMNLDVLFGWRARPAEGDTLDIYFDIINVLNRPNFFVASTANGNQNSGNFARYTLLRSNGIRDLGSRNRDPAVSSACRFVLRSQCWAACPAPRCCRCDGPKYASFLQTVGAGS